MNEMLGSWVDGIATDVLPIDDRGLQYGDGLFETVLVRAGCARFLEAHLARLALGCERLAIDFAAPGELRAEIAVAAAQAPPLAILKLMVTRGSARHRGYAPPPGSRARRMLTLHAIPQTLPAAGVELRVANLRLADNPALAGIKHLNRLENVLAAAEPGHESCFDSLLLDANDFLIGGTMSNVFIARKGGLATPLVDRCGVAGVMRAIVLREAQRSGVAVEQRRLTLAELFAADEVFITNARIGVVTVRRVGQHVFAMNETSRKLAAHIEALDA